MLSSNAQQQCYVATLRSYAR